MKTNIIIGKMYEILEESNFIAYVIQDEQKANDKLAELSKTLIEHNKTDPCYGINIVDLSNEEDNKLHVKWIAWQKINPFPQFKNGANIEEFFIEQHEVL